MAELAQNIIDELHSRKALPPDPNDPLAVVTPGEGKAAPSKSKALAPVPTKDPKVVSNKADKEVEAEILALLKEAHAANAVCLGHRFEAVKLMHSQYDHFSEEKLWVEWGKKLIAKSDKILKITRGDRDVRAIIALAKQDDPKAAYEEELAKTRERHAALKAAKDAAVATADELMPTTDPGNPTPKKLLKRIGKMKDDIEAFASAFFKGKMNEDETGGVTMRWSKDDWSKVDARLEGLRK